MARNDKTSAVELHIEVNEQNLSMFSDKNNTSTLRLPTDPSWPKIPLRRITNTNDIIEPSRVITLMGTPTKNNNIMRAVTCPHSKPNKKYEMVTQIPKKLPGCVDPRFRRQILQQKTKKSDESCNMENNVRKIQLDRCITQKIKTIEENSQRKFVSEKTSNYMSYHDTNKLLENITQLTKESTDCLVKKESSSEVNYCTIAPLCVANERDDIKHRSFQEQKQDVKITCQNDSVKDQETVGNICTTSTLTSKSTSTFKNLTNKKCLSNGIYQYDVKSNDDASKNKSILCYNKFASDWIIYNKEKINLNVSLNQETIDEISINKNHQNFNITDNIKEIKNDKNILNLNIPETLRTFEKDNINSYIVIDNHITDNDIKRERSSEKILVANSVCSRTNIWKQKIIKNKQLIMNELAMSMRNDKMLSKCIHTSALSEIKNKKYIKNNDENKEENKKSYINQKRKTALLNLSKKAKSFFRKKSRLVVTDSNCTFIPGPCRVKGIRQLLCKRDGINGINSIGIQSNLPKRIKFCSLKNLQTENSFEKLSSISLESQKLLNKNYWKYYIKPKRKISMIKSATVGKRNKYLNKSGDYLLEPQTLQQCSLLSMINTVLRHSAIDEKLSSNLDMSVMCNVHKNSCNVFKLSSPFVKKIKREKVKQARKLLLKTIALLSITIYVAVIFLPMIYDYFFDEECDSYENENYIEFQYIASSFEQIFNRIIDVLSTILLRIQLCEKSNDVA